MLSKEKKNVHYIGDDLSTWKSIQEGMESLFQISDKSFFDFKKYNIKNDPFGYQSFIALMKEAPDIVYLDFSVNAKKAFTIGKLIRDCQATQKIIVVALVDYLNHKKMISFASNAAIGIIHIKGTETHDVFYHACAMAFPNETPDPDFARADFQELIEIKQDMKVSYLTKDKIRVESDALLNEEEFIKLEWKLDEAILPSKEFKVLKAEAINHIYHKSFCYDLEYLYAEKMTEREQLLLIKRLDDPYKKNKLYDLADLEEASDEDEEDISDFLVFSEDKVAAQEDNKALVFSDEDEEIPSIVIDDSESVEKEIDTKSGPLKKLDPMKELVNCIKGRLLEWITANEKKSSNSDVKVLVIDGQMNLLQSADSCFDDLPYHFRFQNNLKNAEREINSFRPDIIAFQYETVPSDIDKKVSRHNFNSIESLDKMIKVIRSQYNYHPVIVIFNNSSFNTQKCRDLFEYAQIIVNPNSIDHRLIMGMAKSVHDNKVKKMQSLAAKKVLELKRKDSHKYEKLKAEEVREKKMTFSPDDELGNLFLKKKVRLISMTESELSFISEDDILMYSSFKIDRPIPMQITIIPKKVSSPGSQLKDCYRAMIHSINVKDKQSLRRFVNSIFGMSEEERKNLDRNDLDNLRAKNLENGDERVS